MMQRLYTVLLLLLWATVAQATTFVVNTTADGPGEPGPATQTLRWAIAEANGDGSATPQEPHLIRIDVTGTLVLTSQLPSLGTHISILGPATGFTIQAHSGIRPLGTPAGNTITLTNLTITGGGGLGLGGGVLNNSSTMTLINCTIYGNSATQRGGGIYSRNLGGANPIPQLHLINCKIHNNASTGTSTGHGGGGVYADGPVTIENSQIYNNMSAGLTNGGGGIYAISSLSLTNSAVYDNLSTRGGGGGIYVAGTLIITGGSLYGNTARAIGGGALYKTGGSTSTLNGVTVRNNLTETGSSSHGAGLFFNSTGAVFISNSAIHNNQALATSSGGGGIRFANSGSATITNSTLFGNSATGAGGGISNASTGRITLHQATVVANSAGVGGGFWGASSANSWLNYSIVSGNTSPNGVDLNGSFNSEFNYNRLGSVNGYTWVNPDPANTTGNSLLLLYGTTTPTLVDNGGTEGITQTVALVAGANPAVLTEAGTIASLAGVLPKDQRGFLRNNPNSRSIGAYERDAQAFYLADIEANELLYVLPGSSQVPVTASLLSSAGGNLTSATVRITGGYREGKDQLTATELPAGVSSNWDASTGTLTLSGSASPLAYQTALRRVTYQNLNSLAPDFGLRTVAFTTYQEAIASNLLSRVINVTPPPQPLLGSMESTALEYVIGCNEAVSYRLTTSSVVDAFGLNSLTVQITNNYQLGSDVLSLPVPPAGMTAQWDPSVGKLTLTGNLPGLVYQQALRAVLFKTTSASPSLAARTVTVTISDGFNPPSPGQDTRTRQIQPVAPTAAAFPGQNVVFPNDAVINILCYRADLNQGVVDATPYIMQAIAEHTRDPYLAVKRKVLYFPNGTYKLSDAVFVDNLNATFTGNGNGKGIIFQGQSRDHTILKLTDNNPNFQNPDNPRPVLSNSRADYQPGSFVNVAFKQGVFNLTIDVGSGNPGAAGLRFIANNQGSVRDVLIRSADGLGWAGHGTGQNSRSFPDKKCDH
ncbi:hypothetical protein GCM10023189_57180 [Nibrella saemangeumensis]|uniref:Right handed beta helix domain-containing protein n=1 Tax=Nibrella saemangeumensis TaxID=1084526 RepID=A0ABP8NQL6_9BACT